MNSRERLALDLSVFALVIIAANPAFTGLALHEWLGLSLVVPALLHLVLNWEWVVNTVLGFIGQMRAMPRINLVVDSALFVSLIGVTVSGILVIPGLAVAMGWQVNSIWHAVHLATSNLTVALMLMHFALHWNWMARVVRRMFAEPVPAYAPAQQRYTPPRPTALYPPTPQYAPAPPQYPQPAQPYPPMQQRRHAR